MVLANATILPAQGFVPTHSAQPAPTDNRNGPGSIAASPGHNSPTSERAPVLHTRTPHSIARKICQLENSAPLLHPGIVAMWNSLEEQRNTVLRQYLEVQSAPEGVCIATATNKHGKTYARAQCDRAIFDGKKTHGLSRAGSPEHRAYEQRIEKREALAAIGQLEDAARAMVQGAVDYAENLNKQEEVAMAVANFNPAALAKTLSAATETDKAVAIKDTEADAALTKLFEATAVATAVDRWLSIAYPSNGITSWMRESLLRSLPMQRDRQGVMRTNNIAKDCAISRWPAPEKNTPRLCLAVHSAEGRQSSLYCFEATTNGAWAAQIAANKNLKNLTCTVLTNEEANNFAPRLPEFTPSRDAGYKRKVRKGRGLPKGKSTPKPKKMTQKQFSDKWASYKGLAISAAVRPQDGLWQVEVQGYAPMHGADLELLDLCVQSIVEQEKIQKKHYPKSTPMFAPA